MQVAAKQQEEGGQHPPSSGSQGRSAPAAPSTCCCARCWAAPPTQSRTRTPCGPCAWGGRGEGGVGGGVGWGGRLEQEGRVRQGGRRRAGSLKAKKTDGGGAGWMRPGAGGGRGGAGVARRNVRCGTRVLAESRAPPAMQAQGRRLGAAAGCRAEQPPRRPRQPACLNMRDKQKYLSRRLSNQTENTLTSRERAPRVVVVVVVACVCVCV